jgi:hypothetical protein
MVAERRVGPCLTQSGSRSDRRYITSLTRSKLVTDPGRSEPDTAETITKEDARLRWDAAMQRNGWERSVLQTVMFDSDRPTDYCVQAPAWTQVALPTDPTRADRRRYLDLEERLIAQGRRRSGAIREILLEPYDIDEAMVATTIEAVSAVLDPACVTHEQVLRAAFIAHLPPHLAKSIGTIHAAVHLERQTPSREYRVTGDREMVARYDLGFGNPAGGLGILGVAELKIVGSLDAQLSSGVKGDLRKLLDRDLAARVPGAFRISWLMARRRAGGDANRLAREGCERLLSAVESELHRTGRGVPSVDARGWLSWRWDDGVRVQLAWYEPTQMDPASLGPVFC